MTKNLCIGFIYGPRNAGDMALNYGALDLLNAVGDFDIVGLSRFSDGHECYLESKQKLESAYPNFRLQPFPVFYDRHSGGKFRQLFSCLRGAGMYLPSLLRTNSPSLRNLNISIGESRHFLFNGGNVLFSRSCLDLPRLAGVTYPLYAASKNGIPFSFLPQSIPACAGIGGNLINRYLEKATFVSFRESASLNGMTGRRADWLCTLDLAFFISRKDEEAAQGIMRSNYLSPFQFVPIVPRATTLGDQGLLNKHEYAKTVAMIGSACEKVIDMGFSPVIVVQVGPDKNVAADCQEFISHKGLSVPIVEEYDPLVLRSFYELARSVITMRLHASIFALSVGTIAFGFSRDIWGKKMPGIFSDLGISDLFASLHDDENGILRNLQLLSNEPLLYSLREAISQRIKRRTGNLIENLGRVLL